MTNKELVTAWFANIDSENFDSIKNLMDSNHKFFNPMTPAPVGVDEHLGMMQMMTSAFSGKHHLDLMLEDGNHVVVKGHWSGKHTGTFNGVSATGNDVTFTFVDIFLIENGKVTKEHLELNPMSIMMQIGDVPANV
jgi:predicted ester cyclase